MVAPLKSPETLRKFLSNDCLGKNFDISDFLKLALSKRLLKPKNNGKIKTRCEKQKIGMTRKNGTRL